VDEGLRWLEEKKGGEGKIEAFEHAIRCEGKGEFIRKDAPL
jgi:hypothetical protein